MPIARTSFIESQGENINHYVGVRMRLAGAGELEMTLRSMDNQASTALTPFTMASLTDRSPYRIANFKTQRAQLEITTDTIDETFTIKRIIIYMKPTATMFPG